MLYIFWTTYGKNELCNKIVMYQVYFSRASDELELLVESNFWNDPLV